MNILKNFRLCFPTYLRPLQTQREVSWVVIVSALEQWSTLGCCLVFSENSS